MTDLVKLGEMTLANSRRWFPEMYARGFEHEVLHQAMGIAGEAGEVLEIVKKLHRGEGGISRASLQASDEELGEELADVLIYVLNLATLAGVDLDYEVERKTNICEERWGERP